MTSLSPICICLVRCRPGERIISIQHQQVVGCKRIFVVHIVIHFGERCAVDNASAFQKTLARTSSLNLKLRLRIANSIRRIVRIILSHKPPIWDAIAGLNCRTISRRLAACIIWWRSSSAKLRCNSLWVPTDFSRYQTWQFWDGLDVIQSEQIRWCSSY